MKTYKSITLKGFSIIGILFASLSMAQGIDEWSGVNNDIRQPNNIHSSKTIAGAPDISDLLFVGTSTNNNLPAGTANDVFAVDTGANTSQSIFSATGVWGATADPANERILFTQSSGLTPTGFGGDNLFEVPYTGGAPVFLGRILNGIGEGQRIDGLAMRNGRLYGYAATGGTDNGLHQIDLQTFVATQISTTTDSISGLDADPETCIIYGTNDTTGQVVTLDTAGVITNLAAYPAGITDIDGIAVGGGFAYLVTDEAQPISVLNLSTLTYGADLTSPFAAADIFSAGALALPGASTDVIFENGFEIDLCVDIM